MHLVVHIVLFDSGEAVVKCLESLRAQQDLILGQDFVVEITDNASTDDSYSRIKDYGEGFHVFRNTKNMGFCAAHNQGVFRFLKSTARLLVILNPDTLLPLKCLSTLLQKAAVSQGQGCAYVPKLLRTDEDLVPFANPIIDSTGIIFTSSLRHFDRGAGQRDRGQFEQEQFVEGGTGACLALSREFILRASLNNPAYDDDLKKVYSWAIPQTDRVELFDEAFFAYREDADLALRAKALGLKYLYCPQWLVYHRRKVTPERRQALSPFINALGVRNRFLLQLNNLNQIKGIRQWIEGVIFRNLLVIIVVVLKERTSLVALKEVYLLSRRAFHRNRHIQHLSKTKLR